MRELVYLSERKLRQFAAGQSRGRVGLPNIEGELKTPIGGLKFGHTAKDDRSNRIPDLDQVISSLDRSDRAAKWFEDDSAQPGEWVHFEARLNCRKMDEEHFLSAVLFLNVRTGDDGGRTRLLLHGSPSHLLGTEPQRADVDLKGQWSGGNGSSSSGGYVYDVYDAHERERLGEAAQLLSVTGSDDVPAELPLADSLTTILGKLDRQFGPMTASWMAGYARITGVIPGSPRTVIATPLYVEHIPPHED